MTTPTKKLDLYTGQVCMERRYLKLGLSFINTTVKMGVKAFAPTWDMVMKVKSGEISEEEYTDLYFQMMSESYANPAYKEDWDDLINRKEVIITCFCSVGKFCHRLLLAEFLARQLSGTDTEINFLGEYILEDSAFTQLKTNT